MSVLLKASFELSAILTMSLRSRGEWGAALEAAAVSGNLEEVKSITNSWDDMDWRGDAMWLAARHNHYLVVHHLLDLGVPSMWKINTLLSVAERGNLQIVEMIVPAHKLSTVWISEAAKQARRAGYPEIYNYLHSKMCLKDLWMLRECR